MFRSIFGVLKNEETKEDKFVDRYRRHRFSNWVISAICCFILLHLENYYRKQDLEKGIKTEASVELLHMDARAKEYTLEYNYATNRNEWKRGEIIVSDSLYAVTTTFDSIYYFEDEPNRIERAIDLEVFNWAAEIDKMRKTFVIIAILVVMAQSHDPYFAVPNQGRTRVRLY